MDYERFYPSPPEFLPEHCKYGYINSTRGPEKSLPRSQLLVTTVRSQIQYHFSVQVAMLYDSAATAVFLATSPKELQIDYGPTNRDFKTLAATDILAGRISSEQLHGKIVMIGFLGPGNEDKATTPRGVNSIKDELYGVEYLSYLVAQILENGKSSR